MDPKERMWMRKAKGFWQQRQLGAEPGKLTGYLLDESPVAIGRQRLDGEWAEVAAWISTAQGPAASCLDLGCGTGAWLRRFATCFGRIEGWDYAPAMVAAAGKELQREGIRHARLRCGRIQTRRGRACFDVIFVGGVLMYTPEDELKTLLRALARLLKPDGLLILRETLIDGPTQERQGLTLRRGLLARPQAQAPADYVAIYRSVDELTRQLKAAGLKLLTIRPNRHYKYSDLSEDWLRRLDRLSLGRLRRSPAALETAADWVYHLRWILLYPEYKLRRWQLKNHWLLLTTSTQND